MPKQWFNAKYFLYFLGGTSLLRREINGGKIYFYKHAELLDDPELRKLINESNTTFISSRNVPITVQSSRNRILELSREHRYY